MSEDLQRYLELESVVMQLDDAGSPDADAVRDLMDPVWFRLSETERAWLDARGVLSRRH